MKGKTIVREKTLVATVIMIIIIAALFLTAYFQISSLIQKRSLSRMEEGVNSATEEIIDKLDNDSKILNATANIIANADSFDAETIKETMSALSSLLETVKMRVLLPDNTIIQSSGEVIDSNDSISFDELASKGEHVSNRVTAMMDDNLLILRHYVPIVKNKKTVAILYGITKLSELPKSLNIDNIYNARASVYIINTENGDFIMDTLNNTLGNIHDYDVAEIQRGMSWEKKVQELLSGKKGYVVLRPDESKGWMYFYYAPAGINQWSVAISVPEEEAFANVYAIRRVFLVIAFIMAVAVALYYICIYLNTKQTTRKAVEQAVLEEKLQKAEVAERAKTMFLSNMSHDIRTPMNAIIGFTTLAQTNIDNKERVHEYLAKILSSSNHLLSLINDVLDMSRIESGRLNIEEKECSISDIFRDMRNIIQTQMHAKQINFFMDTVDVIDEDIYCDKLHVNQILLNLLGNAIKFTPAGGSVSLTIKQIYGAPKGYGSYEIRVKDTGIGMSPDFVERLFEPFERERNSTVSGIQGTGLGMPITKSIVEAMGGTIQVETEPGLGTEFIVNLEFRLVSERKQVSKIEELEGLRALVVDDSFTTCDSVAKMLVQIGMRAEWTLRGKEAVLRAKQAIEMGDQFYAYIIDWALPDLGGIEVARQIRSVVESDIPIIILTAYDWSLFEDEARKAGVTAFCNKPIFMSDLRDTLISALGKEQLSVEEIVPQPSGDLKGKRLLLVEDNELNREIAEELLIESGFVVETAEDGKIAVNMVEKSKPGYYSLILMDVQMPIMNGYDATKAIRKLDNPALANIPIVAMTANAFEEDRKTALESGMNAHVAKPIDVEKLMEVLQSILQEKEK